MRRWKCLAAIALLLWERVRGPKTVSLITTLDNQSGQLRGITVRGYEITIFCHRKEYYVAYDRWCVPNRTLVSYQVFSVVSSDAPQALHKACELDVDFPTLAHPWNFNSELRKQHVQAYLDLLERRLRCERET